MARPRVNPPATHRLLDRAFELLRLFDEGRPEWTESELARESGLPSSTANRIVRSLEARALLVRTPVGRYRLGPEAVALGRRAAETFDIALVARPQLELLAKRTGETALLAVAEPGEHAARYVDRVETRERLRVSFEIGVLVPLHAGATARAILAQLPPNTIDRILRGPLPRLAAGTITEPERLSSELERTRRDGYAKSIEETSDGAWGVAAPAFASGGAVAASLAIIAPLTRLDATAERRCRAAVLAASGALTAMLGGGAAEHRR